MFIRICIVLIYLVAGFRYGYIIFNIAGIFVIVKLT